MTRETLGEFEHQVLVVMLRLGGEAFTAAMVLEIERLSRRPVSAAAVYIALRRLERRGLVVSHKEAAAPGEGGRGQRRFAITPEAIDRLRSTKATLERFWDGVEPLLEEA